MWSLEHAENSLLKFGVFKEFHQKKAGKIQRSVHQKQLYIFIYIVKYVVGKYVIWIRHECRYLL